MRLHVTYTATPEEVAVADYISKQTGRNRGNIVNSLLRAYASGHVTVKGLPEITPYPRSKVEYEGLASVTAAPGR
jgi:hypothetical protein